MKNTGPNQISLDGDTPQLDGLQGWPLTLNDTFGDSLNQSPDPVTIASGSSTFVQLFNVQINSSAPAGLYQGSYDIGYTDQGTKGSADTSKTFDVTVTPEPSTWAMMAVGLGGVMGLYWRRKKGAASAPPVDCTPV